MNIVFLLGGVEVDIKEHEIEVTNKMIPGSYEQCSYEDKGEMKLITSPGKQKINGYQAIAYTRIRYSDSAIQRDARQRQVIMSMIDGLKPSQRKVLYTLFQRNFKNEVKVELLSGSILELAAYHHGPASLEGTIVGMAQDFVGSNNINLLNIYKPIIIII